MALTERLQILVTADGKGAVNEFGRIGATAEKELGKTDDRLKRLSSGLVANGTQIAVAGGLATAGIFALAKASGDYEEAASAAGVIFGDSAEAIEDFGTQAIKSAGLSRRAAVEAANTFGTFGKAAGLTGDDLADFSTELTQLAGDLASFKNTTTEEAILAIGAALRGESEPIRRYGVLLDDATLKQRAMELGIYDGVGALDQQTKVLAAQAEILAQTSDAQGDFARTSDSLSNQTRSFTAQIENLKVGLGEGAVPVFSELVGTANDALLSFQNLSPETQNLVGRLGAIAAIGGTGLGIFSVIVGGGIRAVDTFRDLAGRLSSTEVGFNRLTTAAKVAGGTLATIVISDQLFQLLNDGAGRAKEVADAINGIKIAARDLNAEDAFDEFGNLVAAEQNTLRFQNLWQEFGSEVELVGLGIKADVEQVQRAFDQLAQSDPEAAGFALDQLEASSEQLDRNSRQYQINTEFIDRNRESLRKQADANRVAASGVGVFGEGLDRAFSAAERGANRLAGLDEATDEFGTTLDNTNKLLKLSGDLFDLSAQRAQGFLSAIEDSSAIDDLLGASLDLRDSSKALLDGIGALAGVNVEEVASGFGEISDEAAEALRDVLAVGDDAQAAIAGALQFQGADAARAKADQIRDGLVGVLDAAGVADDQIQYLLESIGLTEGQVDLAIQVSGDDVAIAKLTLLRDFYTNADGSSGIPKEVTTQITAAIDEGRFVDAANLLGIWVRDTEDGYITDPLLVAMGLGDTKPASDEVDRWKGEEEQKPPAEIPVDANTEPARGAVGRFLQDVGRLNPVVNITTRIVGVAGNIAEAGVSAAERSTGRDINGNGIVGRAMGGPVQKDQLYSVNEPALGGELFRPETNGFVMNAADTDRLIGGLERLLAGGGNGMTVQQTIVTPDPLLSAAESARKLRDASYLVGA